MSAACLVASLLAMGYSPTAFVGHTTVGSHTSQLVRPAVAPIMAEDNGLMDQLSLADKEQSEELKAHMEQFQQNRVSETLGKLPANFRPALTIGLAKKLGALSGSSAGDDAKAAMAKQVLEAASAEIKSIITAADAGALVSHAKGDLVAPTAKLEVEPYHDIMGNLPMNTFKNKAPLTASVVSVKRLVGPKASGEVMHVTLKTGPGFKYWEGQSLGIIPPGVNPKNNKPNAVRLYSIASTRNGDALDGETVSLCVRRAVYWDPEKKAEDPAKKGVCSNFLCDAQPGDPVEVTGPTGKVMLLPESTPSADIIMVATGTGIAPYRGFIRRLFVEDTPAAHAFNGLAWLFLGVPTTDNLLYHDDWAPIAERDPARFRLTYAISREQNTADGRKMYVQDRLAENAAEVFERMDKGAHMYFCGLKGMMPGILETLEQVCKDRGMVWEEKLEEWKKNGQWHVEVY